MKKVLLICVLTCFGGVSYAQSDSYRMLQARFEDCPEVRSFRVNGTIVRIIVNIVEDDEEQLAEALKDVKKVRMTMIPTREFEKRSLTVNGFKSYLLKDDFELMGNFVERGESVAFYHREENRKGDRYFVIIEQEDDVIAIEMKGYIDPAILMDKSAFSSL